MKVSWVVLALSLSSVLPEVALGQEEPSERTREAQLFGSDPDPSTEAECSASNELSSSSLPSREDALFGTQTTRLRVPNITESPMEDTLTLGGQLYLQGQYALTDNGDPLRDRLTAPSSLYLYLDGRPSQRVRVFARSRVDHQFMMAEPANQLSGPGLFGLSGDETLVALDQFWLKFDIERRVFVTVGRQRIKWGAARLWNPTDFINQEIRDPLAIFDIRLGVPLLKFHIPFEAQGINLYAIALLGGASTPSDVGVALRGEAAIGVSELSLSFASRRGRPTRLGADLSAGVGPLELRFEGAARKGGGAHGWRGPFDIPTLTFPEKENRNDEWLPQGVVSVEWGIPYGDQESIFLTAEYFYNKHGVHDPKLYPWLFSQGEWEPLYVGQHYFGGNMALPRPGSWNDSTFVLSVLGNLSDESYLARFDYQVRVLTRLNLYLFTAYHFGSEGEFNYALKVPPVAGVAGLENGLSVPGPRMDLGFSLSTSF